jgi:hypothetical protein
VRGIIHMFRTKQLWREANTENIRKAYSLTCESRYKMVLAAFAQSNASNFHAGWKQAQRSFVRRTYHSMRPRSSKREFKDTALRIVWCRYAHLLNSDLTVFAVLSMTPFTTVAVSLEIAAMALNGRRSTCLVG